MDTIHVRLFFKIVNFLHLSLFLDTLHLVPVPKVVNTFHNALYMFLVLVDTLHPFPVPKVVNTIHFKVMIIVIIILLLYTHIIHYLVLEYSLEYRTLVNCTKQLELALYKDRDIAHFLHKNGLITQETVNNDPQFNVSSRQKAGLLVTEIKNKVCLNSENYHKFVQHLRENERQYKDILCILIEEYKNIEEHKVNFHQ